MEVPKVPHDVVRCIIDCVQDTPTLFALTLVSHDVKLEAERSIWRSLSLQFDDERSVAKCALATNDPRGKYVREFHLSFPIAPIPHRHPKKGPIRNANMPPIETVLSTLARLLPSTPNTITVRLAGHRLSPEDASAVCAAFAAEGCLPRVAILLVDHQMSAGLGNILDTHPSVVAVQILNTTSLADPVPVFGRAGVMACYQCSKSEPARRDGKLISQLVVDAANDHRVVQPLFDGSIRLHTPPSLVCLQFNSWSPTCSPIVQRFTAARALHLAAGSSQIPGAVDATPGILDAIASLPDLEELIWTWGSTVPAQQELFARDARGETPRSLRRVKFIWLDDSRTLRFHCYVREDLASRRWSPETQETYKAAPNNTNRPVSRFAPRTFSRVSVRGCEENNSSTRVEIIFKPPADPPSPPQTA